MNVAKIIWKVERVRPNINFVWAEERICRKKLILLLVYLDGISRLD
jgi:hypothetical protein